MMKENRYVFDLNLNICIERDCDKRRLVRLNCSSDEHNFSRYYEHYVLDFFRENQADLPIKYYEKAKPFIYFFDKPDDVYDHFINMDSEEEESESTDEEEQPRELTENEQELLDDYNRQAEQDARQEAYELEQESNERRRLNNSELLEILRGYGDSGTFHLEISDSGLERVTRRDGEQEQIIYSMQDGIIPEPIEDDQDEQDEQDAARLRQVLENLKKQKTSKKTFYEEKCVICLEEKPDILFCNCGHIPICAKCDDLNENSNKCPICKTDSDIKHKL